MSAVAKGGHVYRFKPDLGVLERTGGSFEAAMDGIAKCSTFKGFCNHHDTELFKAIEAAEITPTPEQAFLFGYRALCRALYARRRRDLQARSRPDLSLSKSPPYRDFVRKLDAEDKADVRRGLELLEKCKSGWDKSLHLGDFSRVHFWAAHLNTLPHIVASGALFPDTDCNGKPMKSSNTAAAAREPLTLTITCSGTHALIMFVWMQDREGACERFVESFVALPCEERASAAIATAAGFDNCFISPDWWEHLDATTKRFFQLSAIPGQVQLDPSVIKQSNHGSALTWQRARVVSTVRLFDGE